MNLIINIEKKLFDTTQLKKGTLIYAKHKSWSEGKSGFVTAVSEYEIIVQYHPKISNITNHFFIPVKEVIAEEWTEIRWSNDLKSIFEYQNETIKGDNDDTGTTNL